MASGLDLHSQSSVRLCPLWPLLPLDIAQRIFSMMDARTLAMCGAVDKLWRKQSLNPLFWQMLCQEEGFDCGPGVERLFSRCDDNTGLWWKLVYRECRICAHNWEHAIYRKQSYQILEWNEAVTG
jgi:F-box-like